MPFRVPSKPEEKPKQLLYSKPWWRLWLPKAKRCLDNQNYVWKWVRRWKLQSEVDNKTDYLYYTSKGAWILDVYTYKHDNNSPLDSKTWVWFIFKNTLEEIETRLKSNQKWKSTNEAREVALTAFRKLRKVKDGELTKKGECEL